MCLSPCTKYVYVGIDTTIKNKPPLYPLLQIFTIGNCRIWDYAFSTWVGGCWWFEIINAVGTAWPTWRLINGCREISSGACWVADCGDSQHHNGHNHSVRWWICRYEFVYRSQFAAPPKPRGTVNWFLLPWSASVAPQQCNSLPTMVSDRIWIRMWL